jgi:mevalonate kinase
MQTFRANGKLLISGEYFVLDGARALAVPTQRGQSLQIQKVETTDIHWQSQLIDGRVWFECRFDAKTLVLSHQTDEAVATRLLKMLRYAKSENGSFLIENGLKITTQLEFEQNWGLGSSSTLVCTIAKWAKVDAFQLLFNSMKGSGYDIACGMTDTPLLYQINQQIPKVEIVDFQPTFSDQIYFVHLGKKQNSREGIARYRQKSALQQLPISTINDLTNAFLNANDVVSFNKIILEHEQLVSNIIELPRAKDLFFKDYIYGEIKSLGAWGGDFVMVSSDISLKKTKEYFTKKGFSTILPYKKMIL